MKTETLAPAIPSEVDQLTKRVLEAAEQQGLSFTTAESCTGGLLASLLTDVDGLGHCFERGIVAYSNEAKQDLLGVSPELISKFGAVSELVAREMAKGALGKSDADIAVAITGFAGSGGPGDEPGLVHFACAGSVGEVCHLEKHFGDIGRGGVRVAALKVALQMLLDHIEEHYSDAAEAGDRISNTQQG
jgi:nicotinamide-nucleotide amidase